MSCASFVCGVWRAGEGAGGSGGRKWLGKVALSQLGELTKGKQTGEMTDEEAAAKIAAGMKGLHTRKQVLRLDGGCGGQLSGDMPTLRLVRNVDRWCSVFVSGSASISLVGCGCGWIADRIPDLPTVLSLFCLCV